METKAIMRAVVELCGFSIRSQRLLRNLGKHWLNFSSVAFSPSISSSLRLCLFAGGSADGSTVPESIRPRPSRRALRGRTKCTCPRPGAVCRCGKS
ncbi:hypothetical protein BpHYR1_026021 [Brachionus plicatilis]|uniref:Uncharacterized protein n=1 Tax=Brachionus plicatilis TaxID=10195 RepID=A0A3M7PPC3_BRAPC|nr:hypothetical protein BpHYR1_026021 [Brachionus plicatilis]